MRLLLLALLLPAAAAQPITLAVDPVAEPASAVVALEGAIELPDGATTNTWVEIHHEEAPFRSPWRVDAAQQGMGAKRHVWNTTWNTTLVPDGDQTLRFQAHAGDGRSSTETVLVVRTANGNWARLVDANVSYAPVGIVAVNVTFEAVVEAGFVPAGVSFGTPHGRVIVHDADVTPLGNDTYALRATWRATRPADVAASFDVSITVLRRPPDVFPNVALAAGSVPVVIQPWEDQTGAIIGPERNTTATVAEPAVPVQAVAVLGGAVLIAAAGVAAATEAGRVGLLTLFSRITGPKVLDHAARQRIHDEIVQRPGIRFRDLRRRIRLGTGSLVHHLRVLEREGLVRRHRDGGRVLLRPVGAAAGTELHPLAYALWQAIARSPSASLASLAASFGVTRQAMHHHLRRLRALGVVAAGGPPWEARPPAGYCRRCHWLGEDGGCPRCGG